MALCPAQAPTATQDPGEAVDAAGDGVGAGGLGGDDVSPSSQVHMLEGQ